MSKPEYDFQVWLEERFSKNQLIPRIKEEFEESGFPSDIQDKGIPVKFGMDLLAQMAVHKRANLSTLIGLLRHHFEGNCQETADWLLISAQRDLVNWNHERKEFVVIFTISADVQAEIDKYQYPLPMVVEPRKVTNNLDTGYVSDACKKGSVILRDNHHNDDIDLDHLNLVNSIALSINVDVMVKTKDKWRNHNIRKPGETIRDFKQRMAAFDKYNTVSREVMDVLIRAGNVFYLTHRYDKRGRTYCMGYHVDYQGTEYRKAVVQFADMEVVPL